MTLTEDQYVMICLIRCVLPNIKENIVSVWEYICDCEMFCCDCLMFYWKDDNLLSVIQNKIPFNKLMKIKRL